MKPDLPVQDYRAIDFSEPFRPLQLLDGITHIIHAAGVAHQFDRRLNVDYDRINVEITRELAAAAVERRVSKVVFISSVAVYGGYGRKAKAASPTRDETAAVNPESAYGQSKKIGEETLARIVEDSGTQAMSLRLATLYGNGDPGNVARLIQCIDRGRFVSVGNERNLKSLIHRDDAARACVTATLAADPVLTGGLERYNVTAPPVSMQALVHAIYTALGKRRPSWHIPAGIPRSALSLGRYMPVVGRRFDRWRTTLDKWTADDAYDGSRFCETFNFQPNITLERGITEAVHALRENTNCNRAA